MLLQLGHLCVEKDGGRRRKLEGRMVEGRGREGDEWVRWWRGGTDGRRREGGMLEGREGKMVEGGMLEGREGC